MSCWSTCRWFLKQSSRYCPVRVSERSILLSSERSILLSSERFSANKLVVRIKHSHPKLLISGKRATERKRRALPFIRTVVFSQREFRTTTNVRRWSDRQEWTTLEMHHFQPACREIGQVHRWSRSRLERSDGWSTRERRLSTRRSQSSSLFALNVR